MRTYARIQDGVVAELLNTDGDIISMFHPSLVWIDVTSHPDIAGGWRFDGASFSAPLPPPPRPPAPTIAELQAQIAALGATLAALADKT